MNKLPVLFVTAAALLSAAPPLARLPHPSAYRMANVARLIVEGDVGEGGRVAITRRYFAAPGVVAGATITVPALVGMSREVSRWGQQVQRIPTQHALLFLGENPRGDEWVPLHLLEGNARGVLWFGESEVWGYSQVNPGPYELARWEEPPAPDEPPQRAEPDDIRAQIAQGLLARTKWEATLAIEDPVARATAVARWFSPATSPDGARWLERLRPDLRDAANAQCAAIVPPLARLVATDADATAVGSAITSLVDQGEAGRLAVPMLIARLRDLRGASPTDLLRGLWSLGDERAIPVLRDYLAHEDHFVAAAAGLGLHYCGDPEAGRLVAARVPRYVDGDDPAAGVAELLDTLHKIDPAAAEAMARERFLDEPDVMGARGWLQRMRR